MAERTEESFQPLELNAAQRAVIHAATTGQPIRLMSADEAMVAGKRRYEYNLRGLLWKHAELAADCGKATHVHII